MRLLIIFSICFTSTVIQAAPYFKYQDRDGEIIYSDTPPYPGAQPLNAPELQTTPAVKFNPKPKPKPAIEEKSETKYLSLAIFQPGNDETVRNNNGDVSVALKIIPELNSKEGHYINYYMDGKLIKKNAISSSTTFNNIDRGSHSLKVEIKNKKGKLLKASASNIFHLHRFSKLHNKPTPPPPPATP
jgi:Domain of unknown function (DUF4124)